MKSVTVFLSLWLTYGACAQDVQKEINEQVWKPFVQAFSQGDADGFLAVHSKDVIRSPRDSKKVFGWTAYLDQQRSSDQRAKDAGRSHSLELRFTERIAQDDRAVEVGVYKTTTIDKQGNARSFFGRFHVVLRKEGGAWKILVDTDSSEGGTIGEKEFLAAKAM